MWEREGANRDFHSFKHTFARIALEYGAEITWVSQQLAHSSIQLTEDLRSLVAAGGEDAGRAA